MSRKIEYRVWDNKNKSYSDPYRYTYYALTQDGELDFYLHGDHNGNADPDVYLIEQYTGLRDKNGKKIYEGDIVKVLGSYSSVYQCDSGEWVLPYFYKDDDPISSLIFHCDKGQVEIVGNIHENRELLGRKK